MNDDPNDRDDNQFMPPGMPPAPPAPPAAGPIKKQAQPCPGQCGGTLMVPEAFPNYTINQPHFSIIVVVHENPIRCSTCRNWWTVGVRDNVALNLGFMPAPPPADQPQVETVKLDDLPANLPPNILRLLKGGKGH